MRRREVRDSNNVSDCKYDRMNGAEFIDASWRGIIVAAPPLLPAYTSLLRLISWDILVTPLPSSANRNSIRMLVDIIKHYQRAIANSTVSAIGSPWHTRLPNSFLDQPTTVSYQIKVSKYILENLHPYTRPVQTCLREFLVLTVEQASALHLRRRSARTLAFHSDPWERSCWSHLYPGLEYTSPMRPMPVSVFNLALGSW
jgi:hypothetical protein